MLAPSECGVDTAGNSAAFAATAISILEGGVRGDLSDGDTDVLPMSQPSMRIGATDSLQASLSQRYLST